MFPNSSARSRSLRVSSRYASFRGQKRSVPEVFEDSAAVIHLAVGQSAGVEHGKVGNGGDCHACTPRLLARALPPIHQQAQRGIAPQQQWNLVTLVVGTDIRPCRSTEAPLRRNTHGEALRVQIESLDWRAGGKPRNSSARPLALRRPDAVLRRSRATLRTSAPGRRNAPRASGTSAPRPNGWHARRKVLAVSRSCREPRDRR